MNTTPEVKKRFVTWKWVIAAFIVTPISLLLITPTFLLRKTFELLHNAAYKLDAEINELVVKPVDVVHKWCKK